MKRGLKFLTSGICIFLAALNASAGTVSGVVQNAQGGPLQNGTLTFQLTQPTFLSGTALVVPTSVSCFTDTAGNVTGEPSPLALPVVTPVTTSGTLPQATYYVRITYNDPTGQTVASPELPVLLSSTGSLVVTAPTLQPTNVTSYSVYISSGTPGAETLQGSVSVTPGFWANYTQSSALVVGSALPSSNTTVCKIAFNDTLQPSFVCYTVGIANQGGTPVPGFPQLWYFAGGANGTVNVSGGGPQSNVCQSLGAFFPQPVLQTPQFGAGQTVGGPLTLPSVNKVLWIDGVIIPNIAACLAQLPTAVYTACANGDGQCWVSGGGECHIPSGYSETLTTNIAMANAKHLVGHPPFTINQACHPVTAASGTHGWSMTCVPGEDHSQQGSGCTWFYGTACTGSQFDLGDSSGTINDITIQGQQIHAQDAANSANALHIQNCKDCKLTDIDMVCANNASNSGNGLLFEGTGGNLNGNTKALGLVFNHCNNPAVIQGTTGFTKFELGNIGGAVGTPGPIFAVQGGAHDVDIEMSSFNCCSGSTAWSAQVAFAGTANGNRVTLAHNSNATKDVTFGASTGLNTVWCPVGGCSSTNSGAATNQVMDATTNGALVQAILAQTLQSKTLGGSGSTSPNTIYNRFLATQGTALSTGDFSLTHGGSWGSTASLTVTGGRDSAFVVQVSATGSGQQANPAVTIAFHDGSFSGSGVVPVCTRGDSNAPVTAGWATNTGPSGFDAVFQGTPNAGTTYQLNCIVVGR